MTGRVDLPDGRVAFQPWSHALCATCGMDFEVSRTEPQVFASEDAVECDTCLLLDELRRRIEGRP